MKMLATKIFGLVLFAFLLIGCETNVVSPDSQTGVSKTGVYDLTSPGEVTYAITQEEINGLIHMRIEEKLARDAYIVLGNTWNAKVFLNIQVSEQAHMDAVKRMLDKYNIPDPLINSLEVGEFPEEYPEFQDLYDQLMAQGIVSLYQGLLVGVTIEELDIADLEAQLELATNSGIIKLYTNLKNASTSHLAAFNKNLIGSIRTAEIAE